MRLLLLLLCVAVSARSQAAAPPVPSDWLAVVATRDLPLLLDQADALLGDLKRPERGMIGVLRAAASRLPLAEGSVIVGLRGSVDGADDVSVGVTPFALLPVSDFDLLVERLGAEPTGATAVMTLGGSEVELVERDGWAVLRTPGIPNADASNAEGGNAGERDADADSLTPVLELLDHQTLVVAASKSGLEALDRFSVETRDALALAGNRFRFGTLRYHAAWSLEQTRTLVAMARPLFATLKRDASAVRLGASRTEGGDLELTVDVDCPAPTADNEGATPDRGVAIQGDPPARPAIFDLPIPTSVASRRLAAGLYLASVAMQPDAVDLRAFPGSFSKFDAACRAAFEQVSTGRVLAIERSADSPLGANQVAALRVPDAERFAQSVADAVSLWNQMLTGAGGNEDLVFQATPVDIGGHAATRYWANVVDPADADRVPEIKTTMRRFYGDDGKASFYVVPLADDLVVVADMTAADLAPWLDRVGVSNGAPEATGDIAVDRLVNWQQQVWAAMMDGALGYKASPPFPAAPPCEVALATDDRTQSLRLRAPQALVKELGQKIGAQ